MSRLASPRTASESPPPSAAATASRVLAVAVFFVAGCAVARAAERDRIAEVLELAPGMTVADVGAGSGAWAVDLAERVGEAGHVYATEVDEAEIDLIERRRDDEELENLTVVLGGEESTGLPPACCDAILLRLVYHHFTRPEPMRASLLAALKPGGRIAVIDMVPRRDWSELPDVPDRGGHGIAPDVLVAEMIGGGFEVVERIDDWPGDDDHFCVVFRRPAAAEAGYQATP